MDFKEDQLALEAYVRHACNGRDDDDITDEEVRKYSLQYEEANPWPGKIVKFPTKAIVYNRFSGDYSVWRRIPKTEFYWEPGDFWNGVYYWLVITGAFGRDRPSLFIRAGIWLGLLEIQKN